MIEINLLPKELKRKGRRFAFDKNLVYLGIAAGVLVILFVVISTFQSFKIKALDKKTAEAKRKTEKLRKNIELVDALSDLKEKILQRMSAIETLDKNRATWVHVLEDLSQRVPEYLWLSVLREEEAVAESQAEAEGDTSIQHALPLTSTTKVSIEGYTYSINSLALFLIQLTRSDYFKNMDLQFIKKSETEKQKIFSFGLSGELVYTPEPEFKSPNNMEMAQK
ncbi:MAG: PilN domain-containing protein [candidate division Zixibacteria bacterium]|nr:PilN domain-containing protein [candidate division Zixibacteria bacterium]